MKAFKKYILSLKSYQLLFILLTAAELGHFGVTILEYSILAVMFFTMVFNIMVNCGGNFVLRKFQLKYLLLMSLFTIYGVASYFWSYSMEGYRQAVFPLIKSLFIALYLFYYSKDKASIHKLLYAYLAGVGYMCLRVIIYIPILGGLSYNMANELTRVSTGLQTNTVGQVTAFAIIILFYINIKSGSKFVRVTSMSYIGICTVVIYVSGSRKAMLMPLFGIILILFLENKIRLTVKSLTKIITVFGILLFMAIYLFKTNEMLYNRMFSLFQGILTSQSEDGSYIVRMFLIEKAKYLFFQKPVLGWGINSYAYYNYGTIRNVDTLGRYAHNNYWDVLACLGILGLLLYYVRYIYACTFLVKKRKECLNFSLALSLIIVMAIFEYGIVSYYFVAFQTVITLAISTALIEQEKSLAG